MPASNFSCPKFKRTPVDDGFSPADPHTKEVYQEVEAFARQGQPVVIFGPTGAGKEFLARHYYKIRLLSSTNLIIRIMR